MASDAAVSDQKDPSRKDPITCHVLDTTTGLPAAGMSVGLRVEPSSLPYDEFSLPLGIRLITWKAKTNADGRIMHWVEERHGRTSIEEFIEQYDLVKEKVGWVLKFDTKEYFGVDRVFFPAVEVQFYVESAKKSHVHVPLLIGPYSYTTYRGS